MRLTAAQEGIWFAQQLDPASPAYNCADAIEIDGAIDPDLLRAAIRRTIAEAEPLHVRVDEHGEQRLVPVDGTPELADLRPEPDPAAAAEARMRADLARPVDLAAGPLFAGMLLRLGDARWTWYHRAHHLGTDAYAMSMLARRVAETYDALLAGTEPGETPFRGLAELVADDEAHRASQQGAADRAFWLARMADAPAPPVLAGRVAPASRGSRRETGTVPAEAAAGLDAMARAVDAVRPELVIAAFAAYVARLTGAAEVTLGLPVMGRMGRVALRVPGVAVNIVALRLRVDPAATLGELAVAVRDELRAVRPHGRHRFEDLRRDLGRVAPDRRPTGPLVNIKPFVQDLRLGGHRATIRNLAAGPVDDLTFTVHETVAGGVLGLELDANPALYTPDALRRHRRRLEHLLATARADTPVAALEVIDPDERRLVVEGFNATAHPVPRTTLTARLEAQAARSPHALALVAGDERLTYAQLHERANRLAHELVARGAGPDRIVGVALERSAGLLVALLAVLKAGAAYLPLEPGLPAERRAFMLADAEAVCVVEPGFATGGHPATPPVVDVRPEHAAYVIYTSGSTGRPKGVVVEHAAICNRLAWMQGAYGLRADDRILQKTPIGFDVSVWELFWALLHGATLVMAEPGGHRDPAYLADVIWAEAITTIHFVPSMLEAFLDAPQAATCTGLRRVVCSGEALGEALAARFHATLPGVPLHNLYGPTEAAVDVTAWEVRAGHRGPVPIGRPVWNTRMYVLDAAGAPAGIGVAGDLLIAGAQVARGYLARPELTAERFVADPFAPGGRAYRTGDVARWRPDGALEFLGRSDHQVKLRGQRIEPAEIEAAMLAHPGVAQAVVVLRDGPGGPRLVGYTVPAVAEAPLRTALAAALPSHMVPAAFVGLDAMPLTASGKLDRAALPEPARAASGGRAPRTLREERLCALFAELLEVAEVGADDDVFDLGGHSLLAARLAARIRTELGTELSIADLFAAPTPARLAERLGDGARSRGLEPLLALRAAGDRDPLFCIHPAGGLSWCYAGLLRHLPGHPVLGLQARGLDGGPLPATLTEMAADYADRVVAARPDGPVHLLGWSIGGVVAHELAVQLQARGREVGLLAVLDAYPADQWRELEPPGEREALRALLFMAGLDADAELERDAVLARLRASGSALAALGEPVLDAIVAIVVNNSRLMREHEHGTYDGAMTFVTAAGPRSEDWLDRDGWRPYVRGAVVNHDVDATHPELTGPAALAEIGPLLATGLHATPTLH